MALVAGDSWLEKGDNLLVFGPPGGGKSHLAAAIGLGLIENGWRVLFARTTDLVQKLQVARRELALESVIAKLDKYHLSGVASGCLNRWRNPLATLGPMAASCRTPRRPRLRHQGPGRDQRPLRTDQRAL